MTIGLDTGLGTFGWAELDDKTCKLVALGVIESKPEDGERWDRAMAQAREVAERAKSHTTVVIEALPPPMMGSRAMIAIGLSYGVALGIAAAMTPVPRVLTIAPRVWQRLVQTDAGKKVDYNRMATALERHIEQSHPMAARDLAQIPLRLRDHAIDAAALALVGRLYPGSCMVVRTPRSRRSKALTVVQDEHGPRWIPEPGVPAGGRDECRGGARPCVYVRCKHHLWLQLGQDRAGRPHKGKRAPSTLRDVWNEGHVRYPRWHVRPGCELPPSCSLDVAESNPDGLEHAAIGASMGIREERARQLYEVAEPKYRAAWARAEATPGS